MSKSPVEYLGKSRRGVAATILFVVFINFFLYHAFGTGALTLILFALDILVISLVPRKPLVLVMFCVGVMSALAVSLHGSEFVETISVLFSAGILMCLVYIATSGGGFFRSFSEILLTPLSLIVPYIYGLLHGVKMLTKSGGRVKSLSVGLAAGIPIALMLIQHFIRADAIFAFTVKEFVNHQVLNRIMTHGIVSIVVFFVLLPIVFLKVRQRIHARELVAQFSFTQEATVIVGFVVFVVGAFLVVQFPYIFVRVAAETDLSRFGVATYSEYVKQGFGEFILISLILYVLGWFGLLGKSRGMLQAVLIGEVIIYIVSIFRRIWLYISFHGLTLGRLYGGLFLIWVSFMFVTLAARRIWPKVRWVTIEVMGTTVLFLVFACSNMEHLVATWRPPTVNGRVDHVYLSRLSSDGYVGWYKAFVFAKETLTNPVLDAKQILDIEDRQAIDYARIILAQLTRRHQQYAPRSNLLDQVYVWNLSGRRAYARMKTDMPISEQLKLQEMYVQLAQRIAQQPQSEQGYSPDISFDGPFLSPR